MTDFGSISEVILFVEHMDRMVTFYEDAFELEVAAGDPDHGFVRFDAGACSICLHAGGEGEQGRDAPKFVFEVPDLSAARDHLRANDVELGEVRSPAPGVEVCDGLDPEGNAFSIETSS